MGKRRVHDVPGKELITALVGYFANTSSIYRVVSRWARFVMHLPVGAA